MPRPKKGVTHRLPKPHPQSRRWRLRIGQAHAEDDLRRRVEKGFWWPGDCNEGETPPPHIVADAVAKQDQWRQIEKDWLSIRPRLESICPNADWSVPVWFDAKLLEQADAELEGDVIARLNAHARELNRVADQDAEMAMRWIINHGVAGLLDRLQVPLHVGNDLPPACDDVFQQKYAAGVEAGRLTVLNELRPQARRLMVRPVTIRQAITACLANEEARTKLRTGPRIEQSTYNGFRYNLLCAFGLSTSPKMEVYRTTPLNVDAPLLDVNKAEIEALAYYWHQMPEGVNSSHSVKNYLNAARRFFRWCAGQEEYGWSMPAGVAGKLTAESVRTEAVPFDPDQIKRVLSAGGERLRLYVLLGLTCGYYQCDVVEIRNGEYIAENGNRFIFRLRSKERRTKQGRRPMKVKHWIAPELAEMIDRHRGQNEIGVLFNSSRGTPLSESAVTGVWQRACERAEDHLCFKQLRKIGYNAIKRLSRNRDVAELWDGHSLGVSDAYDDGVFAPLNEAERKWCEELRALSILQVPQASAEAVAQDAAT